MDYQGIYSWKYLVRKRRKWFIARTAFSEFPENTSLSGQLHPWTLYSREEPVWRKHSWTEQRRLRQDLQPPLAANSSTLKPCCSSYVCTLFLPNFINICHCQLQPERIPVSPSVSEKSLNWRQCLPRSVRIVGPLKLSQMLQGSTNYCRRCFDVISHNDICHSLSSWSTSWLNVAVWWWKVINQVEMVITTLPRCTLFTRSVIIIFKVVVYHRHKHHVNHKN